MEGLNFGGGIEPGLPAEAWWSMMFAAPGAGPYNVHRPLTTDSLIAVVDGPVCRG